MGFFKLFNPEARQEKKENFIGGQIEKVESDTAADVGSGLLHCGDKFKEMTQAQKLRLEAALPHAEKVLNYAKASGSEGDVHAGGNGYGKSDSDALEKIKELLAGEQTEMKNAA